MNQVKIKDVIQADLRSIKNELIENSAGFIQNLIKSLKLIKVKPFSAYKVDLSLWYLKKVYESAFPSIRHGGPRISGSTEAQVVIRNSLHDQDALSATWVKNISLVDKSIVINLLKGIRFSRKVPSFVELIVLHSDLASRAIHNRIRVGNYIAICSKDNKDILLFRSNKISRTKFLAEISGKKIG